MKVNGLIRASVMTVALAAGFWLSDAGAERLVILHTNDTHSIIDPGYDNDLGGVVRRKVVIDSVRSVEPNVLLVDAGDVVQGSLYFTLYGGDVEQKVMNYLGYDIQIPGNHEFDNGLEAMARYYDSIKADRLSANYDFSRTPLKGMFKPYVIKEFDGKRIGFIGINVYPDGLIDSAKMAGLEYWDAVDAANIVAAYLKRIEKVDLVVAVSHIGYDASPTDNPEMPMLDGDKEMAQMSRDIDIIIGGHSHTEINPADIKSPAWLVANADGDSVLVAQTGKYGRNIGEITIDLDSMKAVSRLISVDKRLDKYADKGLVDMLAPYKHSVDSVRLMKLGETTADFMRSSGLVNWMADFLLDQSKLLTGKRADLALVNKGGVRGSILKGDITRGGIMQAFPFDNYAVVLDVPGDVLLATFDALAQTNSAEASANVMAQMDEASKRCAEVKINGRKIDPSKTYRVATINYLANGNDGFGPLKGCKVVAKSRDVLYDDMIRAFESGSYKGKKQTPDNAPRIRR